MLSLIEDLFEKEAAGGILTYRPPLFAEKGADKDRVQIGNSSALFS